jgi:hypothetical protein
MNWIEAADPDDPSAEVTANAGQVQSYLDFAAHKETSVVFSSGGSLGVVIGRNTLSGVVESSDYR